MAQIIQIVGVLAGVLNAIKLIPETSKALKTHHLRDVSWGMLILIGLSSTLWELYGIHYHDWPIIISDGMNMSMTVFLTFLKIHYDQHKRPILLKS